eukprot:1176964-Prorocentrum_minimum.AAC.4
MKNSTISFTKKHAIIQGHRARIGRAAIPFPVAGLATPRVLHVVAVTGIPGKIRPTTMNHEPSSQSLALPLRLMF